MKQMQRLWGAVLAIGAVLIMPVHAQGADYSFTTVGLQSDCCRTTSRIEHLQSYSLLIILVGKT